MTTSSSPKSSEMPSKPTVNSSITVTAQPQDDKQKKPSSGVDTNEYSNMCLPDPRGWMPQHEPDAIIPHYPVSMLRLYRGVSVDSDCGDCITDQEEWDLACNVNGCPNPDLPEFEFDPAHKKVKPFTLHREDAIELVKFSQAYFDPRIPGVSVPGLLLQRVVINDGRLPIPRFPGVMPDRVKLIIYLNGCGKREIVLKLQCDHGRATWEGLLYMATCSIWELCLDQPDPTVTKGHYPRDVELSRLRILSLMYLPETPSDWIVHMGMSSREVSPELYCSS